MLLLLYNEKLYTDIKCWSYYVLILLVTRIVRLLLFRGGGARSHFEKKYGGAGIGVCFNECGDIGSRHSTIPINLANSKVHEDAPPILCFDSPQQSNATNTRGIIPLPHLGLPNWFDGNLSPNAACFVV